jgi:hypothetical protein
MEGKMQSYQVVMRALSFSAFSWLPLGPVYSNQAEALMWNFGGQGERGLSVKNYLNYKL